MFLKGNALCIAALALAAALAGCGGGSQVEPFRPDRMIAFGDETSVIEAGATATEGRKYTINAVDTGGNVVCTASPLWVQTVASGFDMDFEQCHEEARKTHVARIAATPDAKVADFAAQVDAFVAGSVEGGAPTQNDLATVLVGVHDVVEIYETANLSDAERLTMARQRGSALAAQVNRLALAGPAVIISTIPDVGLTPYANSEGRNAQLLKDLTREFNTGLRLDMLQDGKLIGIVFGEALAQASVNNPNVGPYNNVKDAFCNPAVAPLPDCDNTQADAVSGAFNQSYLWADALRPGPTYQGQLGLTALSRALNNPF